MGQDHDPPTGVPSEPLLTRIGTLESQHTLSVLHAIGNLAIGILTTVLGSGCVILEILGQLDRPWLGIPVGLAFAAFGIYLFRKVHLDRSMRVHVGSDGLAIERAGQLEIVVWSEVVSVSWLQGGTTGKVALKELYLDRADGTRVTVGLERLADPRGITAAVSRRIGVEFPRH